MSAGRQRSLLRGLRGRQGSRRSIKKSVSKPELVRVRPSPPRQRSQSPEGAGSGAWAPDAPPLGPSDAYHQPRRQQQQQQQQNRRRRRSAGNAGGGNASPTSRHRVARTHYPEVDEGHAGRRKRHPSLPKRIVVAGDTYDYLDDVSKAAAPTPLQLLHHSRGLGAVERLDTKAMVNAALGGSGSPVGSSAASFRSDAVTSTRRAISPDPDMTRPGPARPTRTSATAPQRAAQGGSPVLHRMPDYLDSAFGGDEVARTNQRLGRMRREQHENAREAEASEAVGVGEDKSHQLAVKEAGKRMHHLMPACKQEAILQE